MANGLAILCQPSLRSLNKCKIFWISNQFCFKYFAFPSLTSLPPSLTPSLPDSLPRVADWTPPRCSQNISGASIRATQNVLHSRPPIGLCDQGSPHSRPNGLSNAPCFSPAAFHIWPISCLPHLPLPPLCCHPFCFAPLHPSQKEPEEASGGWKAESGGKGKRGPS